MLFSGEIYTTGKNFALPLAVMAGTNLTSELLLLEILLDCLSRTRATWRKASPITNMCYKFTDKHFPGDGVFPAHRAIGAWKRWTKYHHCLLFLKVSCKSS